MTCSPAARAVFAFLLSRASVSPSPCRRSLWPMITYVQPESSSICGDTSPVKAPSFSKWQFWAPSATGEPLSASATVSSQGNGGHRTTVAAVPAGRRFITSATSAIAPARAVFIFQLPATILRRMIGSILRRRPELAVQRRGQAAQVAHQVEELVRQQRLRAVRQRLLRAVVHFHVNAVGPGCHAGPAHARDQVRPARGVTRIDDDR